MPFWKKKKKSEPNPWREQGLAFLGAARDSFGEEGAAAWIDENPNDVQVAVEAIIAAIPEDVYGRLTFQEFADIASVVSQQRALAQYEVGQEVARRNAALKAAIKNA